MIPTFAIHNTDCIRGMADLLEPDSVDLMVSSIPFGALFQYSGKIEDIGNNQDGIDLRAGGFGLHLRFWIEQLLRVVKPGCNAAIHIQQLVTYQVQHGYMGRRDLRGALVDMMTAGGWEWKSEICIAKDPQAIARRQKLHSLLFVTARRNARDLAPCVNDYVMLFQRPGEAAPVAALQDALNPTGWVSRDEWIRDAHGVWTDIRETDVLEGWKGARDDGDEKHVCPLQLEVIRRLIKLYTNPGETVLDPFMGIGSSGFVALEQGRNAVGFELKESYHRQAVKNCNKALALRAQAERPPLDLFTPLEEVAG